MSKRYPYLTTAPSMLILYEHTVTGSMAVPNATNVSPHVYKATGFIYLSISKFSVSKPHAF